MQIFKLVMFLIIASVTPVFAYSDPGSGLMLLQLLGSALVGVLFYFKKIKEWFASKIDNKNDEQK